MTNQESPSISPAAGPPKASREAPSGPPFVWAGAFTNLQREHGFEPLTIHGKLPDELRGTLYRNGPGLFTHFGETYPHWFDGDGVVSAVRFMGGRAEGAARVVDTPGLRRERASKRRLYGGYGTPMVRPLRQMFLGDNKNPSNTGMLAWDSRVFALCEGGKPNELSPADLATLGETDMGGAVLQTFNPHPHRVPAHQATYSVGLRIGKATTLDIYKLPDRGSPQRVGSVPAPNAAMVHDFAVTERHLVVMLPPFRLRMLPLLLRRRGYVECLDWEPERGTDILVIPLADPSAAFRVSVDACYVEHFANAWEQGGELFVDGVRYPDFASFDRFIAAVGRGQERGSMGSALTRFKIDLHTRRARAEVLLREPNELPQIAPPAVASPHRWAYMVGYATERSPGSGLWESVLKLDTQSGKVERFTPGGGAYPFEPLFIPRAGGAAEDDGYLLVHVIDAVTSRSYETVLDARHIADGPVAWLELPTVLPVRLHGAFWPSI